MTPKKWILFYTSSEIILPEYKLEDFQLTYIDDPLYQSHFTDWFDGIQFRFDNGPNKINDVLSLVEIKEITYYGSDSTLNADLMSIMMVGSNSTIKMKYNSSGAKFAFMGFDDSDGKFAFIPDATDTSSVFSGTQGTIKANIETGSGGSSFKVGDSYPFSDSSGTLTLTNIDGIDATTESTFETAIDSLTNLTAVGEIVTGTWSATAIAVNKGGTGLTSVGSSGQIPVSNGSAFVMQDIDGGTYS